MPPLDVERRGGRRRCRDPDRRGGRRRGGRDLAREVPGRGDADRRGQHEEGRGQGVVVTVQADLPFLPIILNGSARRRGDLPFVPIFPVFPSVAGVETGLALPGHCRIVRLDSGLDLRIVVRSAPQRTRPDPIAPIPDEDANGFPLPRFRTSCRFARSGGRRRLPFFGMRPIEGGSLRPTSPPAPRPRTSTRRLIGIARSVDFANRCGFVHRDLVPGKNLNDATGQPQVTDLGPAKRVRSPSRSRSSRPRGRPPGRTYLGSQLRLERRTQP